MSAFNAIYPSWDLMRRSAADDAYTAWFNAQRRCTDAMQAWKTAPIEERAARYGEYRFMLEVEELAAVELERTPARACDVPPRW